MFFAVSSKSLMEGILAYLLDKKECLIMFAEVLGLPIALNILPNL
jgi:hypothetical protein